MDKVHYFFDIDESPSRDTVFVLIIYDITDNRKRLSLSKLLAGYGFRIQKSAFEAMISKKKYEELIKRLPSYAAGEDSIRVYKIIGKGQVTAFGKSLTEEPEDIIVI